MNYNELSKEELLEKIELLEKRNNIIKERAIKYIQDNQNIRLFNSCKNNAKRKQVEFSITIEDIIIPKFCPYLGCKLTNISNNGRVWSNASIDRIDSTKGYVKGNVWVISDLANRMKQNATQEQLVLFAKGVLKLHVRNSNNKKSTVT